MADDNRIIAEKRLKLLKQKKQLEEELPHLYGRPFYRWAKEFFLCRNRLSLLCAANQIGKSSVQIRKCIDWATDKSKWGDLWAHGEPNMFWYLYPSKDVATSEFEKKWIPEMMPRGLQKNSDYYGWEAEYERKHIKAVHFKSGVSIYFKTYAQDARTLQSGSVYAIFTDEELPINLYPELKLRTAGTEGYFHMVFTATLNQEFWWKAIECIGTKQEALPQAHKLQVSMYDCLEYEDGSSTPWSLQRIEDVKMDCSSDAEVQRRVYGKFIKEGGRQFHAFDPAKHYHEPDPVPAEWLRYVGIDIGSGGAGGHPSSIVFVAVNTEYTKGRVYKAWRGDKIQTTSDDVYKKFLSMVDPGEVFVQKSFDYSAVDFGIISDRLGGGFTRAIKDRNFGIGIVNTAYRNDMLFLDSGCEQIVKLGIEMLNLPIGANKTNAKDDLCDAQRYCVNIIPWDFSNAIVLDGVAGGNEKKEPLTLEESEAARRRGDMKFDGEGKNEDWDKEHNEEIAFWNTEYGN